MPRLTLSKKIIEFQNIVWQFYRDNRRDFPWRRTHDPYRIIVSEIMLQQTQATRVVPKYEAFIERFPNFQALAEASTRDVLQLWQGLGYNRRALQLKKIAETIVQDFKGIVPRDAEKLEQLPGIGKATAAAILAFAFNSGVPYLETNVRRLYIHHFFPRKKNVRDADLLPLIAASLDQDRPREWCWAMLDYGATLPKIVGTNSNQQSAHYQKASRFQGSERQLRGRIVTQLIRSGKQTPVAISRELHEPIDRVKQILTKLERDGLVKAMKKSYAIA